MKNFILTMQFDENFLLPIFVKHYAKYVPLNNIYVIDDPFFSTGVVTFNILNFNINLNQKIYKKFKLINTSTTADIIISTAPVLMYNINGLPQFGSVTYTMGPSSQVGFEFINSNLYISIN